MGPAQASTFQRVSCMSYKGMTFRCFVTCLPVAVNSVANPLIHILTDAPDWPLYIGEKVTVQLLVANQGNGTSNLPFSYAVTVQDFSIPAQLELSDTFVYNLTFYAASVLNSTTIDVTVSSVIHEGSLLLKFHYIHTYTNC